VIQTFADVITEAEHGEILGLLESAEFVDGKATAGKAARQVKNNQQLSRDSPVYRKVTDIFLAALRRNNAFRSAVQPRQMHSMLVSRYQSGMAYGAHVDNAMMAAGDQLWRSDLSLTLFLNDGGDYDGGELAIESGSGELQFKLKARAMVCYPTTSLHRVLPVRAGTRLVIVAWVQSLVRDASAREVLHDLETVSRNLFEQYGKTREHDLVTKTHANLLRRWAEP
jgi:PKHD-type hydroxylase